MGLLSPSVIMACSTCRLAMIEECVLDVDLPMDYMCRKYLPGVRIDPSPDYKGEFET